LQQLNTKYVNINLNKKSRKKYPNTGIKPMNFAQGCSAKRTGEAGYRAQNFAGTDV
jgi:hypothetical protein